VPPVDAGGPDAEQITLLRKLAATGDVFIDIGANVGLYTCIALQEKCRVFAFEPLPNNVRYLLRNIHSNGWECEVFPVALSDRTGIATLHGGGTGASLIEGWAGAPPSMQLHVPTHTFDGLLGNRFKDRRVIIKMDVEGAELAVLRGATQFLDTCQDVTWYIEICLEHHHPAGRNPQFRETFQEFFSRGYLATTAQCQPAPVTPEVVERWWTEGRTPENTYNFLFFRPSSSLAALGNRSASS
jgi:FkbM family methyltransferase